MYSELWHISSGGVIFSYKTKIYFGYISNNSCLLLTQSYMASTQTSGSSCKAT